MSIKSSFAPLTPFRNLNYRRLWPGDLLTSWAFEMENLILGWFILAESGSVLLLTAFGSLLYLGTLVSPFFGVLGDRIGHRNLLCLMRASYILLAAVLLAFAYSGNLTPLIVLQISALTGIVRPSDLAIRGALVTEIVPPNQLTAALSISRTTMDSARITGALTGAGLFAILGLQNAYIIVVFFYLAGLLLTLSVEKSKPLFSDNSASSITRSTPWRNLLDGFSYVWKTPHILAAMWVAFVVNFTAFPFCIGLLPYVAKEVYNVDETGLGYIAAGFALGSLLGSL
ncbi:MAG: MFS transporter, partial [Desulfobulbia bacterium]